MNIYVCPSCNKFFIYRKNKCCPHCGLKIVKKGEYFLKQEDEPIAFLNSKTRQIEWLSTTLTEVNQHE